MLRNVLMLMVATLVPSVALAQVDVQLTVPSVRVRVAPPPVRVEVQPARQSPDQIWIAGHWARRGTSNVWISGVWTRPPQDGMVWEKERWDQRDGGAWYYAEGHWRWTNPTTPTAVYQPPVRQEEVAVESAPPRNLAERRYGRPFRGAVWITGYWGRDGGQYSWVAGHWSAPQAHATWTADRWSRARGNGRGHGGRWVLMPGHWDNRPGYRNDR